MLKNDMKSEFIVITSDLQSGSHYFPSSAVSNDESWLSPCKHFYPLGKKQTNST